MKWKPQDGFKSDLTVRERQQLREYWREREIERAIVKAAGFNTSLTCREKPVKEHGTCVGRTYCMCPCHDSSVSTIILSKTDERV